MKPSSSPPAEGMEQWAPANKPRDRDPASQPPCGQAARCQGREEFSRRLGRLHPLCATSSCISNQTLAPALRTSRQRGGAIKGKSFTPSRKLWAGRNSATVGDTLIPHSAPCFPLWTHSRGAFLCIRGVPGGNLPRLGDGFPHPARWALRSPSPVP